MKFILLQRMSALVLGVGLTVFMTAGVASAESAQTAKPVSGTASWFGEWHHGKSTASGEPFDMYAMTAAHRKLPFGTVLKVTNTRNGKDVVVRVNDRGPYSKKRILDLSYAAADRLDMRVSGTAPVTLEVVGDTGGRPLKDGQAFFVRLAEQKSTSATFLEQQMTRLIRVGFQDAATLLHTTDDAVALGPFDTFQAAQETLIRVATLHPRASIMMTDTSKARPVISAVAAAPAGAEAARRLCNRARRFGAPQRQSPRSGTDRGLCRLCAGGITASGWLWRSLGPASCWSACRRVEGGFFPTVPGLPLE